MLIGIDASRTVTAQRTGTEHYSLQLIRHLMALENDHRYRLYFNQPPENGLFAADPQVTQQVMPFPRLWTHLRLSWEMMWRPPDLLFVPAHVLPLWSPRRTVVTIHDLGYLYYPLAHRNFARWYLDQSTRYNAQVATLVIADSQATRQDLIRQYDVDPNKILVVYPGCDETFQPVSDPEVLAAARTRYRLPDPYFLYVGTLQPRKNLVRLVEAYRILLDQYPAPVIPHLVLAGKPGWFYDAIYCRVEDLGLAGRVHFPGYVRQTDLAALLSGAHAFLLPSLYEGFGLPVLEAMACGTPVICSNTSSLPEVAGDAGLLVDPEEPYAIADAMGRLLVNDDLCQALRERGLARATKFTWTRCARQTLDVLEAAGDSEP